MFFKTQGKYQEGISTIHQIGLSCNPLPPVKYGGIEVVITNLTKGLVDRNIPVICYSPLPFAIKGARHYATLHTFTDGPKQGNPVANTKKHLKKAVKGILENWKPGDIIHLHHPQQYPTLSRTLKLRRVFSNFCFIETAHWLYVAMKGNIAYPSESLMRKIGRKGSIIPHGIDLTIFRPAAPVESIASYLFYAGRITTDKGVKIAAQAAKEYGIEFRIAGPIVDKDYAETFFKDVNYLGELDTDELRKQYQKAAALMYMTQYTEPFGLSVVEAMACGCPVITTGNGGTGETVVHGKTGFFCQTKEDVLKALGRLTTLSRQDCVERAALFSIDNMVRGYLSFYRGLYA